MFGVGITVGLTLPISGNAPYTGASVPVSTAENALTRFDLLAMTAEELANVDIAAMNLACAEGLPGFEGIDPTAVLAKLDEWAARVKAQTERHLYRVKDPKYAEHYRNSENFLRAEFLIMVLQEDCGVRYNPDRILTPDFADSRDTFIHGLLDPKQGGTCASMPVLYAAVGRRLGYPIKLVSAREHLFCRWDSPTERFNIDGASNGGWDAKEDAFYHTWPKPITQAEIDRGEYLKSMTPAEELAVFLSARGICEAVNNRLSEGRASLAEAHRLSPQSETYALSLATTFAQRQAPPMRLRGLEQLPPGVIDPTPKLPMPGMPRTR